MRILARCVFALVFSAPLAAVAQHAHDLPLEQRFTAEQLRATGLDRLSPDELALLNRLLREERTAARKAEAEQRVGLRTAGSGDATEPDITRIDSRIKGEFRGWSTGTVFELDNGQRWRVTEGELSARRVQAPKVTINRGLVSGWYLTVEGQTPRAKVQRIR